MMDNLEQQFREHFKSGRTSPYPLWAYWVGVDGKTGCLGREWSDKPHRLVFDLLNHAVAKDTTIDALAAALEEARRMLDGAVLDNRSGFRKIDAALVLARGGK